MIYPSWRKYELFFIDETINQFSIFYSQIYLFTKIPVTDFVDAHLEEEVVGEAVPVLEAYVVPTEDVRVAPGLLRREVDGMEQAARPALEREAGKGER